MGVINIIASSLFLAAVFVIGWFALKALPVPLGKVERWMTATAIGLIVTSECIRGFLYLFGVLNIFPIILGTIAAGLVVWCLNNLHHPKFPVTKDEARSFYFWLVILVFGGYMLIVLWSQILTNGNNGDVMVGPPMLYGDTAVHVAYTTKIAYAAFPPDNPLFANTPLVYPYMPHLTSALFIHFGLPLRLALYVPQFFFVVAMLVLLIKFIRKFCSWQGTLFAITVFFLGQGWGIIPFIKSWIARESFVAFTQRVGDLTHNDTYGMQFANILTGVLIPGRSMVPGMVIGLIIVLIVLTQRHLRYKTTLILGLLLGLLPLWHTHSFIYIFITLGWWMVFSMHGSLSDKIKHILLILGLTSVISLPVAINIFERASETSFIYLISGWMRGEENIVTFWWRNSSLLIPVVILVLIKQNLRDRIFFISSFLVFFIANIVSFQPLAWDNIKLLAWVMIFWSILIGRGYDMLGKSNYGKKLIFSLIFVLGMISGIFSLSIPFSESLVLYSQSDIELAEWVKNNTNPKDIFLTQQEHNHPVSNLAGRSVYMGYQGTLWTYGIDYGGREVDSTEVFAGTRDAATLIPKVSYIVGNQSDTLKYPIVYKNLRYKVYKVNN